MYPISLFNVIQDLLTTITQEDLYCDLRHGPHLDAGSFQRLVVAEGTNLTLVRRCCG